MAILQQALADLARKGAERGADLRPGLALVEARLRAQVDADVPVLDAAARYLLDAGGKRFRPMLVLLCGLLGKASPTDPRLIDAGTIVELVHLSTLYHDDVIDGAGVRRGAPAAHVRWSNTVAILTGDFLLARASVLSAGLGVEVTEIMARTIADLCQGQIREVHGSALAGVHGAAPATPDREHYLRVIGEKTASLIAASCRLGALLSGQGPEAIETLTDYGWRLGMSFQLADDVLDITGGGGGSEPPTPPGGGGSEPPTPPGVPGESGKLPGTDLREGVRTLPVLLALEADGPDSELAHLLNDADQVDTVLALLREHPAIGLAADAARLEAAKAKRALRCLARDSSPLGRTPALDGLAYLADYAASRPC